MRKTINVLAMLFAFCLMAGCSESEPEVVPQAFMSADRLIFDQTASEKPVTVTLVGELAVSSVESSAEDWCTAEMSADAIVVKVTANDTEESRSADVVVKFDSAAGAANTSSPSPRPLNGRLNSWTAVGRQSLPMHLPLPSKRLKIMEMTSFPAR